MAEFFALDAQTIDFESAVDEVDVLVPKYLEAVEMLRGTDSLEDVGHRIENVMVYWERLNALFNELKPLEGEIPFDLIIRDTLQTELATLEQVYLRCNLRIELSESEWTQELWEAAERVLLRMDEVLHHLEFPADHEDRLLIKEMLKANHGKQQRWLMRRHLLDKR